MAIEPEKPLDMPTPFPSARAEQAKWLLVALVAVAGLSMQLAAYPNHDVAWVLWGARELTRGATWGRDIIEPNPPLAWYLSFPSVWLAGLLRTPIAATFEVMVAVAALCSTLAFDRLVRDLTLERPAQRHVPTLAVAFFLLLFPCRDLVSANI